jgi:hypothetical protein
VGERQSAALTVIESKPATEPVGLDMVRDLPGVFQLADALADAQGFLPSWVKTRGQAVAVLLAGRELGIPPMRAFRVLFSIEGKVELASSEMLALLMRGGVRIQWVRSDHEVAHVKMERPGQPPHEETFTIDDAKRAGLASKPIWQKYPKNMLRARCASNAARWYAPDLLGNAYAEGEISDEIETPSSAPVSYASSGSAEVRILNDVQDAAPDDGEPETPEMERAMYALAQCKTDGDMRVWIRTFSALIEREPQTERKVERWKTIGRTGARVTPPVRKAELTDLFRQAREARTQPAASIEDDRRLALEHAMGELTSCETNEALSAWANDNRLALAALEVGSSREQEVFAVIRAHCEGRGLDTMLVERAIA